MGYLQRVKVQACKNLARAKKRGQMGLDGLVVGAIMFVIVAVVISVGAQILGDQRDDLTADTAERNATIDGIDALANMSTRMPLLATVVVLGVIIGVLLLVFRSFSGPGQV